MECSSDNKTRRTLTIFFRLARGEILNKAALAGEFGVARRSIQRDLEEIRVVHLSCLSQRGPDRVEQRVKPVGLMASGTYFYLLAFPRDPDRSGGPEEEPGPALYRLDRIRDFQVTEERFHVPYRDRFEEGEYRRRAPFLLGGRLQRVRFSYTGPSLEAVLDQLPTAQVMETREDGWILGAEVLSRGMEVWMGAQGEHVQPIPLRG